MRVMGVVIAGFALQPRSSHGRHRMAYTGLLTAPAAAVLNHWPGRFVDRSTFGPKQRPVVGGRSGQRSLSSICI
jgi:hypothetical protein